MKRLFNPFHTNVPLLPLATYTQETRWPQWQEAIHEKQAKFQIRVRYAIRTRKNLDAFVHPDLN